MKKHGDQVFEYKYFSRFTHLLRGGESEPCPIKSAPRCYTSNHVSNLPRRQQVLDQPFAVPEPQDTAAGEGCL
jgi:hypothetical protein